MLKKAYLCTANHAYARMKLFLFLKNWTLPVSMCTGASAYLLLSQLPLSEGFKSATHAVVDVLQPTLIFSMLFITFCKINVRDLRPKMWHAWALLFQVMIFGLLSLPLMIWPQMPGRVVLEGAMLCFICPTATAAAVVTQKLGGNPASLTTYIILINLAAALCIPILIPLVVEHSEATFLTSFLSIMSKVFPLLFCPFVAAQVVRRYMPTVLRAVLYYKDLAFYLWAVALSMAIAVTTRSLMHSDISWVYEVGIALASLVACAVQFAIGRWLGIRHNDRLAAAQGMGQKNTVFAIWMGYTFLTPVTSIAGGFYSIWHNVYNSYQLYQHRKTQG